MNKAAFITLAEEKGLSVEVIRGGYSIDKKGTPHSFNSAMLTDYGLSSSDESWMSVWLGQTARAVGAPA